MKTLKISEEKALELYKTAGEDFKALLEENFGEEFFKLKDITKIINNLDDVFEYLDEDIDELPLIKRPKTSFEKYLNACILIPFIVKAYNENDELDWNNTSIYKYLPYYRKVGSGWVFGDCFGWYSFACGSFAHHFKKESLGIDACKKFNQTYIDFYSFKG